MQTHPEAHIKVLIFMYTQNLHSNNMLVPLLAEFLHQKLNFILASRFILVLFISKSISFQLNTLILKSLNADTG